MLIRAVQLLLSVRKSSFRSVENVSSSLIRVLFDHHSFVFLQSYQVPERLKFLKNFFLYSLFFHCHSRSGSTQTSNRQLETNFFRSVFTVCSTSVFHRLVRQLGLEKLLASKDPASSRNPIATIQTSRQSPVPRSLFLSASCVPEPLEHARLCNRTAFCSALCEIVVILWSQIPYSFVNSPKVNVTNFLSAHPLFQGF